MVNRTLAPENLLLIQIRRYPFLSASIVIHALLIIFLLYRYAPATSDSEYYVNTPVQQAKVTASMEKTRQLAMQKDIDNLQAIKDLLVDSQGGQEQGAPADKKTREHPVETSAAKTERELAQQAKQLAADIQVLERQLKAEELARIVNISEAEALQKIQQDSSQESRANMDEMQSDELVEHVAHLEAAARNILAQRQAQMDRQQNGSKVNSAEYEPARGTAAGAGKNNSEHGDKAENGGGSGTAAIEQRINQFLNGDIPLAKSIGDRNTDFFAQGSGHIPAEDSVHIRKGQGRMLGAGAEFSNRFYVNSWYLIGPFGGVGQSIFANQQYPPETAIDLHAVYKGKHNRLLQWQYFTSNEYLLVPPHAEEFAVFYGYTEIHVDQEMDAWLWIGIDDTGKLWLNDREVYDGIDVNKGWFFDEVYHSNNTAKKDFNLTEARVQVRFKKGVNKFLFKVSNASLQMFFSLVITR